MVGFPNDRVQTEEKSSLGKKGQMNLEESGEEKKGDVSGAKGTDLEALCPEHWQWKGCSLIEGITGF